jgi:hypothetical protein
MEGSMTQEAFEKLIRSVGAEHNRPPAAPPLDTIWQRIEPDVRETLQAPTPIRRTWRWQRGLAVVGALAATLVLGIGIGRSLNKKPPVQTAVTQSPEDVAKGAYGAVTIRQLSKAQVLLTSYEKQSKAGKIDPALTELASEILGMIEVLHDSKATQDNPKLKALLQSLELVLLQISTLQPDRQNEDGKFVKKALDDTKIIERLRNALPSSNIAGSL